MVAGNCDQCGVAFDADANRCPGCGAAVGVEESRGGAPAGASGAPTQATDGAVTDPADDEYPDYLSTGETKTRDPLDWPYWATVAAFVGCLGFFAAGLATLDQRLYALGLVCFFATPVAIAVDAKTRIGDVGGVTWAVWPFVSLLAYIVGTPLYLLFRFSDHPPDWP
jgi:hypothetical protein